MKKYTKLWDGIKNGIETINNGKTSEYDKDSIKIEFGIGDNLPLNKTLKLHNMAIIMRSVFEEDGNFILKFI